MKKTILSLACMMAMTFSFAQSVFTYGKNAVSKDEFVRAFNKNPTVSADRKKALKEYLDLFINYKLKVQAAYDDGLDKDATQQYEVQNFKKQLAENIINDEANVKSLVKQAFERSRKEINLQQVFVEIPPNGDTVEAYKKIQSAYKQLKDGKDFGAVAQEFASDEATKQSKGALGFITVFTLPYEIENVAYSLKATSFSAPVKTKIGYHIFKNNGERNSLGTRRVAQILVAVPPNPTIEEKNIAARKADSIYNLLQKGGDFGALATAVSNDLSSSNNKGELPEFSVGAYDADFENVAFSLKNRGELSKPFQTAYGFHILKLLDSKTADADINDPTTLTTMQEKVIKDKRLAFSKKGLIQKKLALIKYKPGGIMPGDFYLFTDSSIRKSKVLAIKGINENTPIFSFPKQNVTAGDWIKFVQTSRNSDYLANKEKYKELYKDFIAYSADEYYRNNLEVYNSDFVKQVKEFKEANLLFAIMEKNVWGQANIDSVGLLQYYNDHKATYTWPPSADAIIITCNNERLAKETQQKLKDNVKNWREVIANNAADITADSGRYELTQLPEVEKNKISTGIMTDLTKNKNDNSYSFSYIVKVYKEPGQRTFEEARGLVISDYQQVLEDKWIKALKKKYPVIINQKTYDSIK